MRQRLGWSRLLGWIYAATTRILGRRPVCIFAQEIPRGTNPRHPPARELVERRGWWWVRVVGWSLHQRWHVPRVDKLDLTGRVHMKRFATATRISSNAFTREPLAICKLQARLTPLSAWPKAPEGVFEIVSRLGISSESWEDLTLNSWMFYLDESSEKITSLECLDLFSIFGAEFIKLCILCAFYETIYLLCRFFVQCLLIF